MGESHESRAWSGDKMPYGPEPDFPQLFDTEWVRGEVGDLGRKAALRLLTLRLGCSRELAEEGLRRAGMAKVRRWSGLEDSVLGEFYPRHQATFVAEALGRSVSTIQKRACKRALVKAARRRKGKLREEFWHAWREWLAAKFPLWASNGLWRASLNFVFRPASPQEECGPKCAMWPRCVGNGKGPLPCEALTVGECLRFG